MNEQKGNKMKKQLMIYLAALAALLLTGRSALADHFITSLIVGPQSPAPVNPGGTATYAVTLNRTNSGGLNANMTISGLPAGATASFSANPVVFSNQATTETCNLTISVASSVANGLYPFSVTARAGVSGDTRTATGTLIVGGSVAQAQAPLIVSISLLPDKNPQLVVSGTPGQPYQLQATADLATWSWSSITTNITGPDGLFTFPDLGATNYPNRFYRAATVQ
jgi:hypothetical protein